MNATITRVTFSVMLILIGSICLVYYAKAHIVKYVSPSFYLSTLVGGLGMVIVGVFLILTIKRHAGCAHDHSDDEDHDHDHDHSDMNSLVALLIIAIPLGFSLINTKHKYSEVAMDKKSSVEVDPNAFGYLNKDDLKFTREMLDEMKEKNANGAYLLEILEIFYSAGDPAAMEVMTDIKVETEGAVRRQPGDEENSKVKRMYRMFMTCCATDMQPMPVKLILPDEIAEKYNYAEHSWMKIEGTLGYESSKSGFKIPVIKVEKLNASSPPPNEILSNGGNSIMQHKM